MYLPIWSSPAMRAGDAAACAAAPVNGVDLFGQMRQPPCAIGALEGDLRRPAEVGGISITPPDPPGQPGGTGGGKGCGCGVGGERDAGGPLLVLAFLAARAWRRRTRIQERLS